MWGGKIVYDHFYIIQNVNKDLDKLRKKLKIAKKGVKYLLTSNREDLQEKEVLKLKGALSDAPLLVVA